MSLKKLSPKLVEKARQELNEDPDTRMQFIEDLRTMLDMRTDLPFVKTDKFLIRFLRARKFDLDKAYELIVSYYEAKRDNPELFTNFKPSAVKHVYESGFNFAFPVRDHEGRRILAFRPGLWDPESHPMSENFRANLMAFELLLEEEETQINGIIIIADFRHFGMKQATSLGPAMFKSYGRIVMQCYPFRLKGIHVLEQPAIFTVIFTIMQAFMKEKLKKRVQLHGSDLSKFLANFDVNIIPEEFGGQQQPIYLDPWVKALLNAETRLPHLWND